MHLIWFFVFQMQLVEESLLQMVHMLSMSLVWSVLIVFTHVYPALARNPCSYSKIEYISIFNNCNVDMQNLSDM